MNILETIMNSQNGEAVRQLGRSVGLSDDQTAAALQALLPALAAGLQRNAQSPDGLASLLGALSSGQHGQYLDNPAVLGQPDAVADGNGILGHVLGSKDVSRQVASEAAAQTGIGASVLKRVLPLAATLVMGVLARQRSGGTAAAPSGGIMGMIGSLLGGTRGGSAAATVASMIGKVLGR